MADPVLPASRLSASMSATTRSTAATHQPIPLITVRRRLLRQLNNTQKATAQRRNRNKHDMEELFKLYYSNDLQFDAFQRQIVTGKRLHTPHVSPRTSNALMENSEHLFDSKVCVSREQISPAEMDYYEQKAAKFPSHQRLKQSSIYHHASTIVAIPSADFTLSPRKSTVTAPPEPEALPLPSSSLQQDELCDSSLVKSVTFLDDVLTESYENMNTTSKAYLTKRPTSAKSSSYSVPHPSILMPNHSGAKYSRISSSTAQSLPQPHRPSTVTGSAIAARQRPPSKATPTPTNQRPKSSTTTTTTSTSNKLTIPTRSSVITSPLSFQSETIELPVFIGSERVVSIPSKCSRYVLVSFPEVPLRYNAPSYVERLLLPERFPNLFQNIVRSYSSRARSTK